MRHVARLVLVGVLVVVVSACGEDEQLDVGAANAAAPSATTYADTASMLDALNQGGFVCEPAGATAETVGSSEECGREGGNIVTSWVFPDEATASQSIGAFIAMIEEQGGGFDLVLQGPNWMLTASELDDEGYVTATNHDDLVAAQEVIGGTLVEIDV